MRFAAAVDPRPKFVWSDREIFGSELGRVTRAEARKFHRQQDELSFEGQSWRSDFIGWKRAGDGLILSKLRSVIQASEEKQTSVHLLELAAGSSLPPPGPQADFGAPWLSRRVAKALANARSSNLLTNVEIIASDQPGKLSEDIERTSYQLKTVGLDFSNPEGFPSELRKTFDLVFSRHLPPPLESDVRKLLLSSRELLNIGGQALFTFDYRYYTAEYFSEFQNSWKNLRREFAADFEVHFSTAIDPLLVLSVKPRKAPPPKDLDSLIRAA